MYYLCLKIRLVNTWCNARWWACFAFKSASVDDLITEQRTCMKNICEIFIEYNLRIAFYSWYLDFMCQIRFLFSLVLLFYSTIHRIYSILCWLALFANGISITYVRKTVISFECAWEIDESSINLNDFLHWLQQKRRRRLEQILTDTPQRWWYSKYVIYS